MVFCFNGFFILAFYTYSLTRLLSPLMFICFSFIYRREIFQFTKKFRLFSLIFLGVSLLPFFINFFDPGGMYAPKGALILTGSTLRSTAMEFRSYVNSSGAPFMGKLFFNRPVLTLYEYGKNILAALSPEFFFARGSDMAGIGTNGQFYLVEFLAFIIGLIWAVKHALSGNKFVQLLLGWAVLTILSAALTVQRPYATRTLFLVVPFIIVIALGWVKIINSISRKYLEKLVIIAVTGIYMWHLTFYFISYYFRFPVVYAQNWESENKELFAYLKKNEANYDTIIITKPELSTYAFLLFYNSIPPQDVWTKLIRHGADPDGWKHGKKLGKYEFRDIDWKNDFKESKNVIFVSQGWEYSDRTVVSKEIFYPEKFNVFPHGQDVIAYPEKKVAYRIWKYVFDRASEEYKMQEE